MNIKGVDMSVIPSEIQGMDFYGVDEFLSRRDFSNNPADKKRIRAFIWHEICILKKRQRELAQHAFFAEALCGSGCYKVVCSTLEQDHLAKEIVLKEELFTSYYFSKN